jgi:hypothetical protein
VGGDANGPHEHATRLGGVGPVGAQDAGAGERRPDGVGPYVDARKWTVTMDVRPEVRALVRLFSREDEDGRTEGTRAGQEAGCSLSLSL